MLKEHRADPPTKWTAFHEKENTTKIWSFAIFKCGSCFPFFADCGAINSITHPFGCVQMNMHFLIDCGKNRLNYEPNELINVFIRRLLQWVLCWMSIVECRRSLFAVRRQMQCEKASASDEQSRLIANHINYNRLELFKWCTHRDGRCRMQITETLKSENQSWMLLSISQ